MAFAPPTKTKVSGTNISKSTWTPMNNSDANKEVFEERRIIIKKWFEKWHDKQRRIVIEDIFKSLSEKHLLAVHMELCKKFPEERHDFTKRLPRVLSLYIFSFLDPRSLSRCAQVSWYWKYLTELDCLWKPKCLKFGWYPTHQPSLYEETVYKRHYITTIYKLNYIKAKEEDTKQIDEYGGQETSRTDRSRLSIASSRMSTASTTRRKTASVAPKNVPIPAPKWEPPPWRGSDPHPTDTLRYNYIDNKGSPKNKSRNSQRPKSSSGGAVIAAKKSSQSPSKSKARPGSATSSRKGSLTQSLDPQTLRSNSSVNGDRVPVATSRNMMSTSVSNFSYTGPSALNDRSANNTFSGDTYFEDTHLRTTNGLGHTLESSTRFVPAQLHGSPLKSTGVPEMKPNTKDATIRPKPVTSFSLDKSQSLTDNTKTAAKDNDGKSNEGDVLKIKKPIATVSDYKIKEPSSGKVSPLKGSPWKVDDVISDESDF